MNQEIMENIAKKLKALRVTILEQDISANDIREKLKSIRKLAEDNDLFVVIRDDDYIKLLRNSEIGAVQEEEQSEEYSEEESSEYD